MSEIRSCVTDAPEAAPVVLATGVQVAPFQAGAVLQAARAAAVAQSAWVEPKPTGPHFLLQGWSPKALPSRPRSPALNLPEVELALRPTLRRISDRT